MGVKILSPSLISDDIKETTQNSVRECSNSVEPEFNADFGEAKSDIIFEDNLVKNQSMNSSARSSKDLVSPASQISAADPNVTHSKSISSSEALSFSPNSSMEDTFGSAVLGMKIESAYLSHGQLKQTHQRTEHNSKSEKQKIATCSSPDSLGIARNSTTTTESEYTENKTQLESKAMKGSSKIFDLGTGKCEVKLDKKSDRCAKNMKSSNGSLQHGSVEENLEKKESLKGSQYQSSTRVCRGKQREGVTKEQQEQSSTWVCRREHREGVTKE